MQVGDIVFIIENRSKIVPVKITAVRNGFYTCKFSSGGAARFRRSRLYETEEEAASHVYKEPEKPKQKREIRSPYEYQWNAKHDHRRDIN